MKILITLFFLSLMALFAMAQEKPANLADLKKDLTILSLTKQNLELRHKDIVIQIKELRLKIVKATPKQKAPAKATTKNK